MPKPLPQVDVDTSMCCQPLAESPLDPTEAADLARRLKALADPHRLRLLSLLMAAPDGEACTCDLTDPLGLSQPTVSHHLKKLHQVGLVTAERRGVWTYYRADAGALRAVTAVLLPDQG
ncbi:MAG: metalloregulator ArsR/SmtB family transcription factor [Actinomycetota bacterium]|nr:metalloregulator ArsR/SmtB family transcription factor [Actinomycetota bacterium]